MGHVRPVVFHPSALLTWSPLIFILSVFLPRRITNSLIFPAPLTQFPGIIPPTPVFGSLSKIYLYLYYHRGPRITS